MYFYKNGKGERHMKRYIIRKLHGNMAIDGNVEKEQWKDVEEAKLCDAVTGGPPRQATSFKLMWDNDFLYVAFKCSDTHVNAAMKDFDDLLYNEEVVELFIDDNCDLKGYIEIVVNPLNAVLHYFILNDLKGRFQSYARLQNNIISSVKHDKENGVVYYEIAVPMREFVTAPNIPPKEGDRWLINVYRIDRPSSEDVEYSAWSGTGVPNFHVPESFGEVIFME